MMQYVLNLKLLRRKSVECLAANRRDTHSRAGEKNKVTSPGTASAIGPYKLNQNARKLVGSAGLMRRLHFAISCSFIV